MRPYTGSVNGNDDSVSEFDASTCWGDIFENDEKIITEDSIVWVDTNKRIKERSIIKINYIYLPQDSNYLKMIWTNTKKE